MASTSTLLTVLRARDCLLEGEDALLLSPATLELTPEAQLAYLHDNRKVGRFVTGLAGGVRLALLAGAPVAMIAVAIDGGLPLTWWSVAIWIALVACVVWLTPKFVARMRALGRPLPEWKEIERAIAERQGR